MRGLSRQVSPGAAAVLVAIVLAIVQWVWWRGLVYKNPQGPPPRGGGAGPPARSDEVVIQGHDYVKVETFAGDLEPGSSDGPGSIARFDRPTGIALTAFGTLLVCDTGNNTIRSVASDGVVTTLAGSIGGCADGPALQARFNAPCGVCSLADGTVFVADTGNGRVRRIKDGVVTTLINAAGNFAPVGIACGPETANKLLVVDARTGQLNAYDSATGKLVSKKPHSSPAILVSDLVGGPPPVERIKIAGTEDYPNAARRPVLRYPAGECRVGPSLLETDSAHASVFLVKGDASEVLAGLTSSAAKMRDYRDGNGETGFFSDPTGIVTDGVRYAYVADTGNNCIRRLMLPDYLFH